MHEMLSPPPLRNMSCSAQRLSAHSDQAAEERTTAAPSAGCEEYTMGTCAACRPWPAHLYGPQFAPYEPPLAGRHHLRPGLALALPAKCQDVGWIRHQACTWCAM